MSILIRSNCTGVFTATAAYDAYGTTHLNGVVREVFIQVGKACSTDTSVKVIGEGSTRKVLVYVTDPSTLGRYYYPANETWSTGATVASTFGLANPVLYKERPRVIAAGTSGMDGESIIVRVLTE